jgi:hypothetical protein
MEYLKSWLKIQQQPWIKHFSQKSSEAFPAILALSAKQSEKNKPAFQFDPDSKKIRIDNCASYCISNDQQDFQDHPRPINKQVKGIGGIIKEIMTGTIVWFLEDDIGKVHKQIIPGSLYIPQAPSRLFSPQHWAQVQNERENKGGHYCITYADKVILVWDHGQSRKTIPIDQAGSNVATMWTAPNFTSYAAFLNEADIQDLGNYDNIPNENGQIISDGTAEDEYTNIQQQQGIQEPNEASLQAFDLEKDLPKNPTTSISQIDPLQDTHTPAAELLKWHHKLNHMSLRRMVQLSRIGILPRKLAKSPLPVCPSCMFGKATRRPWRDKPGKDQIKSRIRTATAPGQCVSVDQLESTTPGFIAQIKGWLTTKRYKVATVFVDHYSDLTYVYFQKSTNSDETLEAKLSFERFAAKSGVKILRYQADNGRFTDTKFRMHAQKMQPVTHILWSKCTFSKWSCGKENTGATRSGKNDDNTCSIPVA